MSTSIGGITIDLVAQIAQFRADMKSAAGEVKGFASEISDSLHSLEEFNKHVQEFLAIREVISFLKESAQATQEWTHELASFQNLAGVSSVQAAALAASAKLAGVSAETVSGAFARLGTVIEKTPDKFSELGIKIHGANQQLLPFPQIMANTLAGLDKFKAGADRAAAAGLLVGKGNEAWITELSSLGPLLKSANFADTINLVQGLGLATGNAKEKEEEWNRTTGLLALEFLGFQNQLGEALLPALKSVAESIAGYAKNGDLKRWAEETAQGVAVLTIGLVTLADFVAQHNDLIGVALAAGGTAAIQTGTLKGIAGGVAAIGAAWAITGSKGDAAAASVHKDLQKVLADLKSAQAQIGKPLQGGGTQSTDATGTKSFIDVDQIAKEQKKFDELRSSLTQQVAAEREALAVSDKDASTRRAAAEAAEVQNTVLKFQNEAIQLGTVATKAQTDAIAKWKTEELAMKNVAEDNVRAQEALRAISLDTEGVNNQIRVAQLNHGFTVQEVQDRRALQDQLQAQLAIDKEQFPLTQAQAAARAQAIIDLGQTNDLLTDINAANQTFAATRDPFENYTASMAKLNQQLQEGLIDQDTFSRAAAQAQATLTGVATTADQLRDAGKQVGDALGEAFKSAITPGNDLIATAKTLLKSLEDVALEALVIKPFERGLSSSLQGGGFNVGNTGTASDGSTGSGFSLSSISSFFSGLFGRGSSAATGTAADQAAAKFYANGGSFIVGGRGGLDSNLVKFHATRGERVTIDPAGRAPRIDASSSYRGGQQTPPAIYMTVVANDPNSFRSSRNQMISDLQRVQRRAGRYA